MEQYIATFFNHFGAVRFKKSCDAMGWEARMAPVPRALSSSCGTCVFYKGSTALPGGEASEELEQIVRFEQDGRRFMPVYRAES